MAIATKCQTPGARFHTRIEPGRVSIAVDLPSTPPIPDDEAELLEANLHNAVELVP
jgi:hypothetical protein